MGYFAKQLAANGHTLKPDQLCLFADAYVAGSIDAALKEYAPYYLYFVQTLWHHGSDQSNETLGKAGYVNTSSFDYIRPENQPFAQLDRAKIRQMNLPDVEKRVKDGQLAFGSPKEVADRLIDMAEQNGRQPHAPEPQPRRSAVRLVLEQVRRFGRDVLPRLQAHQVALRYVLRPACVRPNMPTYQTEAPWPHGWDRDKASASRYRARRTCAC